MYKSRYEKLLEYWMQYIEYEMQYHKNQHGDQHFSGYYKMYRFVFQLWNILSLKCTQYFVISSINHQFGYLKNRFLQKSLRGDG